MAVLNLHCTSCGHKWQLVTRGAVRPQQKKCPECESTDIKQSFGSYLRNGPLSSPACGAPVQRTGYG